MRNPFLFILLFLCSNMYAQDKAAQIDSLFESMFEKNQFSGNILIAEKGQVIYERSFGYADHSTKRILHSYSIFELASVSKQFTAAGIMLLKRKGKLSYSDKLQQYFPELPYPEITIRHLLNHTSGLPDYMMLFAQHWDSTRIATNKDVIQMLASKHPASLFKPGDKFDYSNTGYVLLASIIEKVSGKSFADYLKKEIFKPLKMKQSMVLSRRFDRNIPDNYAFGYVVNSAGKPILPDSTDEYRSMVYSLDGIQGDGTVNSTTENLFIWDRALHGHTLFTKEEFEEMVQVPTLSNGKKTNYGFGWSVDSSAKFGLIMNHGGAWPGYRTFFERHITNDKTIIVLSNLEKGINPVGQIRNILYGFRDTLKMTNMSLPADSLLQYKGVYNLAPGFDISIWNDGDSLKGQGTAQPVFDMSPAGKDLFYIKVVDAKILFNRNEQGTITSLTLFQGGEEVTGTKK